MGKFNKTVRLFTKEIINEYFKGVSAYELAKKYKVSIRLIQTIIKENDLQVRSALESAYIKRQYTLNKNCFDIITDESAYWLGLLLTDGYVNTKGQIELALKDNDIKHLEKFKIFVGSNKEIKLKKNNKGYNANNQNYLASISICSKELVNKLNEYNIVSRKTYSAFAPDSLKYNRHFWRGCMDGDGTISINKNGNYCIGLYGTKKLCEQFLEFVKQSFPEEQFTKNVHQHSTIYGIIFNKHSLIIKLTNLLYKDDIISLERKKSKAHDLLNTVVAVEKCNIIVYDKDKNKIDNVCGLKSCSDKYKINYNTLVSALSRNTLCTNQYYFQRV